MADRVGVINHGELMVVEEKTTLMDKLGQRTLTLQLATPHTLDSGPLVGLPVSLSADGKTLTYHFDGRSQGTGAADMLRTLMARGVEFTDIHTEQSSLEEIFLTLVRGKA